MTERTRWALPPSSIGGSMLPGKERDVQQANLFGWHRAEVSQQFHAAIIGAAMDTPTYKDCTTERLLTPRQGHPDAETRRMCMALNALLDDTWRHTIEPRDWVIWGKRPGIPGGTLNGAAVIPADPLVWDAFREVLHVITAPKLGVQRYVLSVHVGGILDTSADVLKANVQHECWVLKRPDASKDWQGWEAE